MVVAPVVARVAPVAPVAPCAGQGGCMTTDLRQFCGLPSTTIEIMVDPIPMIFQPLGFSNGGKKKTPIVLMVVGIPGSWYC